MAVFYFCSLLFATFHCLCPGVYPLASSPVTLNTSLGPVTGLTKRVAGVYVDIFYGIPFATPPVGELRFKPPVPAQPWRDPRDVTQRPNSCWQVIDTAFNRFPGVEMWNPNTPMSEDCLYLNVWRPAGIMSSAKPIMVWIFGGSFLTGSSTLDVYDPSQLAARNDVIVVTIAYRLGALGFLYAGTSDAPGNAGLLDQAMALKWVKDNAVTLGGSPDAITLFGESAGAISIGLHMVSPVSKHLFTYAIMESGSLFLTGVFRDQATARSGTRYLAKTLSCPGTEFRDIVACLRVKDPEAIVNQQLGFFGPVVDGTFLQDDPSELVNRGEIKPTSILTGVNANEGSFFAAYEFKNKFTLDGMGHLTERDYDAFLRSRHPDDASAVSELNRTYGKDPTISYAGRVEAIIGDDMFKCPAVKFAQRYAPLGENVYLYSFEHRLSTIPWPQWMGVPHAYEIEVVFGIPFMPNTSYTDDERELSKRVMTMWTNFAKYGNPNGIGSDQWPRYTTRDQKYVIIDSGELRVASHLRQHECGALASSGQMLTCLYLVLLWPTYRVFMALMQGSSLR